MFACRRGQLCSRFLSADCSSRSGRWVGGKAYTNQWILLFLSGFPFLFWWYRCNVSKKRSNDEISSSFRTRRKPQAQGRLAPRKTGWSIVYFWDHTGQLHCTRPWLSTRSFDANNKSLRGDVGWSVAISFCKLVLEERFQKREQYLN